MMILYSYFRSSTAYRVRIALNLKGLEYETRPVNLAQGEQRSAGYAAINPMAAVPVLVHGDVRLTQSLAIIDYLESIVETPALVSGTQAEQAYIRQISLAIATDIHPLTNLKVLKYLGDDLSLTEDQKNSWYRHWARQGLLAVEETMTQRGWHGAYALGDQVSMADLCIVPQMYNMRRFHLDLDDFPVCRRIERNCMMLDAFRNAAPEMQPDAPPGLEAIHGPHFKAA